MQTSQQPNKSPPRLLVEDKSEGSRAPACTRASFHQRIVAAVVFLVVAASFGMAWLAATGKFDIGYWLGPCGFKQRYGLPCPTCGMTTSVLAFSRGRILDSFYIQPAGGLLCCGLVIIAFLALFTAVFGVYFRFIKRFFAEVKIRHIIVALIIIIAAGWAVTLARAFAANR
jgi:hypothetical protein